MNSSYLKVFVDSLDRYHKLSDAEFGRLMRAALQYKATGEIIKLVGREELLLDGMMLDIDRDTKRYTDECEKRSVAARVAANARWGNAEDAKRINRNASDAKHAQDKDKDKEKEKEKKETEPSGSAKKAFAPPSVEDVAAYCLKRGNGVDARRFWDYYDSAGWTDRDGNPVVNWKQKLIANWEPKAVRSVDTERTSKYPTASSESEYYEGSWSL